MYVLVIQLRYSSTTRPAYFTNNDDDLCDESHHLAKQTKVSPITATTVFLQLVTLHPGECYAIENMTKTDRLGLLLSGKANVLTEKAFLHHVEPGEFLDSPEFESSTAAEDTFKVGMEVELDKSAKSRKGTYLVENKLTKRRDKGGHSESLVNHFLYQLS